MADLIIYADGASSGNPGPGAIGVLVEDELGNRLVELSRNIGRATNNQAEYRALIAALELAATLKSDSATINLDSELIVRQLEGRYKVRNPSLEKLYTDARKRLERFSNISIVQVSGDCNKAHPLAQAGLKRANRQAPVRNKL